MEDKKIIKGKKHFIETVLSYYI